MRRIAYSYLGSNWITSCKNYTVKRGTLSRKICQSRAKLDWRQQVCVETRNETTMESIISHERGAS
jgi:hypothetical protein